MKPTDSPMATTFRLMPTSGDYRVAADRDTMQNWELGCFMLDRATLNKLLCVAFVAAIMGAVREFVVPICEQSTVWDSVSGHRGGCQRDPGLRHLHSFRLKAEAARIARKARLPPPPRAPGAGGGPYCSNRPCVSPLGGARRAAPRSRCRRREGLG